MTKTRKDNEASGVPIASDRVQDARPIGHLRSKRSTAFKQPDPSMYGQASQGFRTAPGRLIPPFDAERVEAIQAAIEAGRFEPHPDVIADKLIENVDELLSRK